MYESGNDKYTLYNILLSLTETRIFSCRTFLFYNGPLMNHFYSISIQQLKGSLPQQILCKGSPNLNKWLTLVTLFHSRVLNKGRLQCNSSKPYIYTYISIYKSYIYVHYIHTHIYIYFSVLRYTCTAKLIHIQTNTHMFDIRVIYVFDSSRPTSYGSFFSI